MSKRKLDIVSNYRSFTSRTKNKTVRTHGINYYLPNEIYKEIFEYLHLEDLANVSRVCKKWHRISKQIKTWDIVLVCDITGSVQRYYDKLIKYLKSWQSPLKALRVRLGFVGYRDHYDSTQYPLIESKNLTFPEKVIKPIERIRCQGGDDPPEAVLDGLNVAAEMNWNTSADKHLILICDAPPHGEKFGGCELNDSYPEGCPCGLDEVDVLNRIRTSRINFWLVSIGAVSRDLELMDNIFRNVIPEMIWLKPSLGEFTFTINRILEDILNI